MARALAISLSVDARFPQLESRLGSLSRDGKGLLPNALPPIVVSVLVAAPDSPVKSDERPCNTSRRRDTTHRRLHRWRETRKFQVHTSSFCWAFSSAGFTSSQSFARFAPGADGNSVANLARERGALNAGAARHADSRCSEDHTVRRSRRSRERDSGREGARRTAFHPSVAYLQCSSTVAAR